MLGPVWWSIRVSSAVYFVWGGFGFALRCNRYIAESTQFAAQAIIKARMQCAEVLQTFSKRAGAS